MPMVSNIDEVMDRIQRAIDGFGFHSQGQDGGTLGQEVAKIAAEGIVERSAQGQRGASGDWPSNDPEYAAEKLADYGWDLTNFRTGQMISEDSMLANLHVTAESVEIPYGTGSPPTHSESPTGHLSASDRKITDVEKANFAHSQGRSFFELDDEINQRIVEKMIPSLKDHLDRELS